MRCCGLALKAALGKRDIATFFLRVRSCWIEARDKQLSNDRGIYMQMSAIGGLRYSIRSNRTSGGEVQQLCRSKSLSLQICAEMPGGWSPSDNASAGSTEAMFARYTTQHSIAAL